MGIKILGVAVGLLGVSMVGVAIPALVISHSLSIQNLGLR